MKDEGDAIVSALVEMLNTMVTPDMVNTFKSRLPPWVQPFIGSTTVGVAVSTLTQILQNLPRDTRTALALRYEFYLTKREMMKIE